MQGQHFSKGAVSLPLDVPNKMYPCLHIVLGALCEGPSFKVTIVAQCEGSSSSNSSSSSSSSYGFVFGKKSIIRKSHMQREPLVDYGFFFF